MLNTNAAFDDTGDLKLRITGTSGSCNYGTYLDLNEKPFSYTAYTWSGNFITTTGTAGEVGGNQWSCTDSYGVAFWALTLKSSDLLNIST
jgi:hypothetical protein